MHEKPFAVNDRDFQAQVLESAQPVLVDFWAPWCGPCRMVAPILEEIAVEYSGRVRIAKVNVDQDSHHASRYGVQGIPTLILFVGGQAVDRLVGAAPKATIRERLEKSLVASAQA